LLTDNHIKMYSQQDIHYTQIAEAINYLVMSFKSQPDLFEVADTVHMSPSHFQRLFTQWAGTSPKKFLQYISIEHAKKLLLDNQQASLAEVAHDTGLSSTSRLHDLFISIEGMTPAEYKNGGSSLVISYSFFTSPFGDILVASTTKGICHMAFVEDYDTGVDHLKRRFPHAEYQHQVSLMQLDAVSIFQHGSANMVKLHLKGTQFQLKVWESLLKIPLGNLTSYGAIASQIGCPAASRAVGTAIGSNPVAYLIPCHRVIQSSGIFGGYMWGETRKVAMIGWEQAQMRG
jgi:AraC family transcriptional regulator, regulatory protein of adaptative response / methylated-DNA-[protein]-cysteine methyltransferase